jgi:cytoskeletal protein CcmA (bactofilin family)
MVPKSITAIQPQEAKEMDDLTHIINGMDIEGVLNGGNLPVVVDGRFTGEIHAERVTIGEYGLFIGKLFAENVEIGGQFNGELICDTLNVGATGKIDGSVKADTLSIDLGAEVMGSIGRAT